MISEPPTLVRILPMDRHFLYLPLYVAQYNDKSIGKLPWFGEIGPEYSVEVKIPEREEDRTDEYAFSTLMDSRLNSSDIMFAVCDPSTVIRRPDQSARIVASIVASAAFWAVNHDVRHAQLISDLSSFDKIVCYKSGTTSNLIARRIAKQDTYKLEVVTSPKELDELQRLGKGTLALSPELIKITNAVYGPLKPGESRPQIVFEPTSKEFSNVLTTVLFTRAEVIDKHPELVLGIATALQRALLAIQSGDKKTMDMVKAAAEANFRDAFYLDEALDMARTANVFPETIFVRRDRWQRASEFFYITKAIAEGCNKKNASKEEQREAEALYNKAVKDNSLERLVAAAITRGFGAVWKPSPEVLSKLPCWTSWAALGLLIAGLTAGMWLNSSTGSPSARIVVALAWAFTGLLGFATGQLIGYRKQSFGYASHWVFLILSCWALHELGVPRLFPDAHFIPGVTVTDGLAGGVLTVAAAWVISYGLFVRGQLGSQGKKTVAHHER